MSGYGVATKKSERPPVQHRPRTNVCGACGDPIENGRVICVVCAKLQNIEAQRLVETHFLDVQY